MVEGPTPAETRLAAEALVERHWLQINELITNELVTGATAPIKEVELTDYEDDWPADKYEGVEPAVRRAANLLLAQRIRALGRVATLRTISWDKYCEWRGARPDGQNLRAKYAATLPRYRLAMRLDTNSIGWCLLELSPPVVIKSK